jgi:uncharacterized membrane protein YqhA
MKSLFERSRYLTLIASVALLIASLSAFIWGAFKTINTISIMLNSRGQDGSISFFLLQLVDIFLIAMVFYIFAVDIYELFIARLDLPEWMLSQNLHELKAKLSSLIILVMGVKFLELVVEEKDPLNTLYLALAIAVVSAALIAFSYLGEKD